MTEPTSIAIWNAARTGPPRARDPTRSATAACWVGVIRPEPTPATKVRTRNTTVDPETPMAAVVAPQTARPTTRKGLRPWRSDHRPAGTSTTALPTANTASAMAAIESGCPSAATTKSGTIAVRTPNTAQPLAKLDSNADR